MKQFQDQILTRLRDAFTMVAQIADKVISRHERHRPRWDCYICKVFPVLQWQTSAMHQSLVSLVKQIHANKMFYSFKITSFQLPPHLAEGVYPQIYINQRCNFCCTLAPCRNVSLLHKLSCSV